MKTIDVKPDAARLVSQSVTLLLGALFVALGAWISFPIPGTDIPQTGQTMAVLVVGALLGPRLGALTVVLYLLLGAVGLPIYSDGGSGWDALFGPTMGYFLGFVLAGGAMGWTARWLGDLPWLKAVLLFAAMLLGHALILLCGFFGLALLMDADAAWTQGVAPFVYGSLVKSLIATLLVVLVEPLHPVLRIRPA